MSAAEEARDLEVVGVVGRLLDRHRLADGPRRVAVAASSVRDVGASGRPASFIWLRWRSSSSRKSRDGGPRRASLPGPRGGAGAARGRVAATGSKPVAMTVIMTSSPSRSLKLVPKMMFASGSAAARISSAASVTSNRLRLDEPVMLNRMPLGARDVDLEERAGDRLAGGLDRPVLARRATDPHERRAGVLHDRADIREVEVDQARGR